MIRKFKTQREKTKLVNGVIVEGNDSNSPNWKKQRAKVINSMNEEEDSFSEDDEVESLSFESPEMVHKR